MSRSLLILFAALSLLAATPDTFPAEIRPLLQTYCFRCHGEKVQTAGVDFSRFIGRDSIAQHRKTWEKALRVLKAEEMPPASPLPSVEERQKLIAWIEDSMRNTDWSRFRNPGHVPLARLNRTEYNNTIRDLTGIDVRPADAFPADSSGENGFNNDRAGLFIPPLLIEKYLEAARSVVDDLVAARRSSEPLYKKLEVEDMRITETGTPKKPYGFDVTAPQNTIYEYIRFPRSGTYVFRVRAWGKSAKPGYLPGVSVRAANALKGQEQVEATANDPAIYTFVAHVPRGNHRVSVHYFEAKTHLGPKETQAKDARPLLSLDWLEISEEPEARKKEDGSRVFIASPGPGVSSQRAARKIVARFAERAFRRPVPASEVTALLEPFRQADRRGEPFEEATGASLRAILVAPDFLFRIEGEGKNGADYRLNDYELASRLSYFLWMSMPDDELFRLAQARRLRDPRVLGEQVRRMMRDPKARAFTDNFFGQWLGYAELNKGGGPDAKTFPMFTETLKDAMLAESSLFFASMIQDDQSLLGLLDADYTFVNEELALHYGIGGITGRSMRRVPLADRNRGGILGLGSVLTATSLPVRTSPVVRGNWLLETLFGEELPPPPMNAGDLPEPTPETAKLTLRQRFEMHRKAQQCASCHNRIDPLGYGLENFDAVGRWRESDNGQPVDSTGVLRTGESFRGPAELRQILVARKDKFIRTVTERMLRFALGRELRYYDEPVVAGITRSVIAGGYRPSVLLSEIVRSHPFRYQRSGINEESSE